MTNDLVASLQRYNNLTQTPQLVDSFGKSSAHVSLRYNSRTTRPAFQMTKPNYPPLSSTYVHLKAIRLCSPWRRTSTRNETSWNLLLHCTFTEIFNWGPSSVPREVRSRTDGKLWITLWFNLLYCTTKIDPNIHFDPLLGSWKLQMCSGTVKDH